MRAITAVMLVLSFAILAVEPALAQAPPPPYGTPISLEQAKKVLAGAEAEAKKNNWNVVIYVLDSGGQPVAMQRSTARSGAAWTWRATRPIRPSRSRRPSKAFQDAIGSGR